jgi:CRP-like cAMP-binding protein
MDAVITAANQPDHLRSFEETLVIKEFVSKYEVGRSKIAELQTSQLHDLCRGAHLESFAADTEIFRQGGISDTLYIVISGRVNLVHTLTVDIGQGKKEVRRKVIQECTLGTHFGEEMFISEDTRPHSAVCSTHVDVLAIKKSSYDAILRRTTTTHKDDSQSVSSGGSRKSIKDNVMDILSKPRSQRTEADIEALTAFLEKDV